MALAQQDIFIWMWAKIVSDKIEGHYRMRIMWMDAKDGWEIWEIWKQKCSLFTLTRKDIAQPMQKARGNQSSVRMIYIFMATFIIHLWCHLVNRTKNVHERGNKYCLHKSKKEVFPIFSKATASGVKRSSKVTAIASKSIEIIKFQVNCHCHARSSLTNVETKGWMAGSVTFVLLCQWLVVCLGRAKFYWSRGRTTSSSSSSAAAMTSNERGREKMIYSCVLQPSINLFMALICTFWPMSK